MSFSCSVLMPVGVQHRGRSLHDEFCFFLACVKPQSGHQTQIHIATRLPQRLKSFRILTAILIFLLKSP